MTISEMEIFCKLILCIENFKIQRDISEIQCRIIDVRGKNIRHALAVEAV